jgi:hypothetical protein
VNLGKLGEMVAAANRHRKLAGANFHKSCTDSQTGMQAISMNSQRIHGDLPATVKSVDGCWLGLVRKKSCFPSILVAAKRRHP